MTSTNIHGKYPRMANWLLFRRVDGRNQVHNCMTGRNYYLPEREIEYLNQLNGDRDIYNIDGFSEEECVEYYDDLEEKDCVRQPGRLAKVKNETVITLFIPKHRKSRTIFPKIYNYLLMGLFIPVLAIGIYRFSQGFYIGRDERWFDSILGIVIGTVIGIFLHEISHAMAALSCKNGRVIEGGISLNYGIIPSAYVLNDTSHTSILQNVQISLAGVEMHLLIAGILLNIMVSGGKTCFWYDWKWMIFYGVVINVIHAAFNILYMNGVDGNWAISSILGGEISVLAANLNMINVQVKYERRNYFREYGVNGVVTVINSIIILGYQLFIPILCLALVFSIIGAWFHL